jgi:mono/diheme cytochrome c family protein
MKLILKIISGILLLISSLILYIEVRWDRPHEAPYPDIRSVNDSAVIARGKHLAFGPAHCATCHVPNDKMREVENGLEMPLIGGWTVETPVGIFRAPNITPDPETGIGRLSDAEIARILRHSVSSDGRILPPFMPFQEMSDEDLTAVISFLRAQNPEKHQVEPTEYNLLGKALFTFGIFKAKGPKNTPPKAVEKAPTVEYGRYLANNIGNCKACHTPFDLMTGEFTAPDFSGGQLFEPDAFSEGYAFVSPNLTPHPENGHLARWSEENFIIRFKAGRVLKGSPMPWGAFSNMDTIELKALYRYFKSLSPVDSKVDKLVYVPGDPLPETK